MSQDGRDSNREFNDELLCETFYEQGSLIKALQLSSVKTLTFPSNRWPPTKTTFDCDDSLLENWEKFLLSWKVRRNVGLTDNYEINII